MKEEEGSGSEGSDGTDDSDEEEEHDLDGNVKGFIIHDEEMDDDETDGSDYVYFEAEEECNYVVFGH